MKEGEIVVFFVEDDLDWRQQYLDDVQTYLKSYGFTLRAIEAGTVKEARENAPQNHRVIITDGQLLDGHNEQFSIWEEMARLASSRQESIGIITTDVGILKSAKTKGLPILEKSHEYGDENTREKFFNLIFLGVLQQEEEIRQISNPPGLEFLRGR